MRKLTTVSVIAAAAFALVGCSDPQSTPTAQQSDSAAASGNTKTAITSFDVSTIPTVDEIAALVPQAIKERNILRNGASTDYAPGEFRAEDGQTPVGYDIDIVKALARVMGLSDGVTTHAEFPTILPALGTKFDVAASSFTITDERIQQAHMISYVNVGSAFAVAKGNPKKFDPTNVCGSTIGVQNGTFQHEYAQELSKKCVTEGKKEIKVMPLDLQTDVATKVVGGQYDATFADSTVVGYSIELSQGALEQVGDVIEALPQGIAVAQNDEALTQAVQKAMQYLMDKGYLTKILAAYGAQNAALSNAEVDPVQQ
ncbi:ABC transporter substrate-binding protein [Schaalia sp. lx-260]|uniref:ABC transporter substrate-binding protein n=1 Tax=Schaalia sp. lx-260 TaxID=2899082 RepID=UPI001E563D3D|nr:ABC transporter substrate-binding protein [Schaalia sp. lx-260]MCD4550370.1 ABC transporter substrate-binding protein [Schaalia sp. lx-260]